MPGLVAFWDFQGEGLKARGPYGYRLEEMEGTAERVSEGVFGKQSVSLGNGPWLRVKRVDGPGLNIRGHEAQVTVAAWIKRRQAPEGQRGCQALAGMWNEHGKRQYALFLNLHIWDSDEQVGAHISATGGASPGYRYCMDAAIGDTRVPWDVWQCVAITYDGLDARAYLNGVLDTRKGRNPCRLPGGIFTGGVDGADFTVGAVARPERVDEKFKEHGAVVANRFHGLLGGLAVFQRALNEDELLKLAQMV